MKVAEYRFPVIIFLWFFFLPNAIQGLVGRDEGTSIPVNFVENREISLNIYPEDCESAAVLTGTGLDGEYNLYPFKRLIFLLANMGIRGTIFVFPGQTFRENIARNQHWIELFSEISSIGFEISQNGAQAYHSFKDEENSEAAVKFAVPSPDQKIKEIKENREFLISLGLVPVGYLEHNPSRTDQIIPELDKMGYLYYCEVDRTGNNGRTKEVITSGGTEETYYPYPVSIAGFKVLKFYCRIDPSIEPDRACRIFDEVKQKSGVFVCQVHLPGLMDENKIGELKRYLSYLKDKNAWICSLQELSEWWLAREKVRIITKREGNILVIVYDNPTGYLLKNCRLKFKQSDSAVRYYRVENQAGIPASQGIIPESRFVNVTLFPDETVR